ncbi:hypothetical protein JAB9_47450 [Janthinobacterium sp. HH107]|uniref:hypothetical protein n=1 Tax=Janthinobacterium sp. HH107 TaxID=1537279 RepID=UPI000873B9D2|nr:hypothetical protein [Janthinobacterium sp. HH107]OEZ92179.1 hypothetical protein JAB9_47450 [Janthinobacterium sp. HH107]
MKNQENKIAANKRLAELLGWSSIVEVGGALVGMPPAGAAASRGQAMVPDWLGDWAAAAPLLAQFEIRLMSMSAGVDASGFLEWYRLYPDKDAAARAAIVKAVTHRLEKAQ